MSVPALIVTLTGTATILVGTVAMFRSLRVVNEVQSARAFFLALCVMFGGMVVGYVGLSIDTGEPLTAAVISFLVAVGGAFVLWRSKAARTADAKRGNKEKRR